MLLLASLLCAVGPFGTTERAFYAPGEPIVFSFDTAPHADKATNGSFRLRWVRSGDDGRTETNEQTVAAGGTARITTALSEPGFVQIRAKLEPGDVAFDGGAGVEPGRLSGTVSEPADFDAFWRRQRERLARVPLKVVRERYEPEYDEPSFDIFRLTVDCAGPQPMTGYLTVPVGAKPKSCRALVNFQGYGMYVQKPPEIPTDRTCLTLTINAHGYLLGKDKAYYDGFFAKTYTPEGKGYAFDRVTNRDAESCYFNGMALRVLRALECVKSLPEWNGRDLVVSGGSQGGLQCCWAAGLDPDVSDVLMNITWCCNLGSTTNPKLIAGWRPEYAPALDYYDPVFHARRFRARKIHINRAALGDEICPPRGLAVLFNNLPKTADRRIDWWQGSRHSSWPKRPQVFTFTESPPPLPLGSAPRILSLNGEWGSRQVPDDWPASDKANEHRYERTVAVPPAWAGRKVLLDLQLVQSCAKVSVDGVFAGDIYYPGGRLDLTGKLVPGRSHGLRLDVIAKPDTSVVGAFQAPGRVTRVTGTMQNRGLCGDVTLLAKDPRGELTDVRVETSVARHALTLDMGVAMRNGTEGRLAAKVFDGDRVVLSLDGTGARAEDRVRLSTSWKDPVLWTPETPKLYRLVVELRNAAGEILDVCEVPRFGFREFAVAGRDFLLNGKKIHLRTFACNLTEKGAATEENVLKDLSFARKMGYNHFLPMEYSFLPGATGYQPTYYRLMSERGMLTSLPLPHAPHFNGLATDEDVRRFRETALFQIRKFQNEPSVVLYVLNHNFAGSVGAQDPVRMAERNGPVQTDEPRRKAAAKSDEIVRALDPTHVVNHHAGDMGALYSLNLYPNWAPVQERSDWMELWEKEGKRPLCLAEYGVPLNTNWTDYRGPKFIFTQADAMTYWLEEYNAAFVGDAAYRPSALKDRMYRVLKEKAFGGKSVWYWQIGGFPQQDADCHAVRREYLARNIPDFRARGLSQFLLWDWQTFWNEARELTPTGETVRRTMQPVLFRLVGRPGDFTERGHAFRPGEWVTKQLQLINDSFADAEGDWIFSVPELGLSQKGRLRCASGGRQDVPVSFEIPRDAANRRLTLRARFGDLEAEPFVVDVVSPGKPVVSRIAAFDPEGTLGPILKDLGVSARTAKSDADLAETDILIFGRRSLAKSPFHLEKRIADGTLAVLVMEQDKATLEGLGFRVQEYGVRRAFRADGTTLEDARGASTLLSSYLETVRENRAVHAFGEQENACVWRAGNRGTVASVLVEKPDVGDFQPLVSAGFDLQYAPVFRCRCGKGSVVFSQLDVCGRTEADPALTEEIRKCLELLGEPRQTEESPTVLAGGTLGVCALRDRKFRFRRLADGDALPGRGLLVVTPGHKIKASLLDRVRNGLSVAAVGLSGKELDALFPSVFMTKSGSWTYDGVRPTGEMFDGLTAADFHWRGKAEGDLFATGDGVASAVREVSCGKGRIVALQATPWQFDEEERSLRTTVRRQSFLLSRVLHNLGAEDDGAFVNVFNADFRNGGRLPLDSGWEARLEAATIWTPVTVPSAFERQLPGAAKYDGKVLYRKTFDLPPYMLLAPTVNLYLGPIDDESWVSVNGHLLGRVTKETNPQDYWSKPRFYRIDSTWLRPDANRLEVVVNDLRGEGGLFGRPNVSVPAVLSLYTDDPIDTDDPYRYYGW